ncbi:zn 2cys6 transcription factor [Niveomyces insectorum RCEF 264]|uniref:Zn 2cys6 transcription factor n=1 Tax=Niveomyces insectorum RCEF 264 TaxID=1081102 RepID=A0A167QZ26_9HYPO|nr:zn 2cys6 transcription factor [Niveomyces insectorum RCEF 264]
MEMKRPPPNYFTGLPNPNALGNPVDGGGVYAPSSQYRPNPVAEAYPAHTGPFGYGGEQRPLPQHEPDGVGAVGRYPEQTMRLGTPLAEKPAGGYEYEAGHYAAAHGRNGDGAVHHAGAGDYNRGEPDYATVRVRNRDGKDVRMLMGHHANDVHVPTALSTASSISSSDFVPPTPGADSAGFGYAMDVVHDSPDSSTDGMRPGTAVANTHGSGHSNAASSPAEMSRKKQKRNKPTLSCSEETNRTAAVSGGRRVTRPLLSKKTPGSSTATSIPNIADRGILNAQKEFLGSVALSTGLLSNVPFSVPSASNVFGIGSEHPFANYWTCEGGLPEVISVLPDKIQCDILLVRYFECFDPVYPMINQQVLYSEFENFWALGPEDKNRIDPAFVGLLFAMLALGTQFVSATTAHERKQTAEFYASASNQALRLSSYLSSASIRSIQAMVLITYFLINDNHASDGWAFAGILMRQAYAMGLHRDPNIVVPNATSYEKQQRRKVWQAVLLQDTFLTVLLSLPPTATHTDVTVEDLEDEESMDPSNNNTVTDMAYIRGSWTLANLVQEVISSPRSLDVPICTTSRHKSKMVSDFRAIYRSFPDVFRSWDPESLTQLAKTNKRVVRQTLFLSSNYFHNLMLIHASESADVPVNVRGTLEAAHGAITSFFVLFKLFENEAGVWWVFNHRAFLEALCIGGVLRETVYKNDGDADATAKDPLYARARSDVEKMIEIMRIMGEGEQGSEVARTRVRVLCELL